MKRLAIVIDCDDVIIDSTLYMIKEYNLLYGANVTLEHAHDSRFLGWGEGRDIVLKRLDKIQKTDDYENIKPRDDALRRIPELAKNHDLHLVTARSAEVEYVTRKMVDKYFSGCFLSIVHTGADRPKGEVCAEVQADVIVDDNYKHIVSAFDIGVRLPIWFGDYLWQEDRDTTAIHGVRCADWDQAAEEIYKLASIV